jgi:hypothetical protein
LKYQVASGGLFTPPVSCGQAKGLIHQARTLKADAGKKTMKLVTISKNIAVDGATFTMRHGHTGQHWLVLKNGRSVAINNELLVSPRALVYGSVSGAGYTETTLRVTITHASVQWSGTFQQLVPEVSPVSARQNEQSVLIWHPDRDTAVARPSQGCVEVEPGSGLVRLVCGGSYDLELTVKEPRPFRQSILHTIKTNIKFDGAHVYINGGYPGVTDTWV